MILKNTFQVFAFRILLAIKIFLYLLFVATIIVGISFSFVLTFYNGMNNAGIILAAKNVFLSLTGYGGINAFIESMSILFDKLVIYFNTSPKAFFGSTLFLVIIILIVSRLIIGMYEIPLTDIIDKYISAKANLGFFGRIFVELRRSLKFVLYKVLYLLIFDICTFCIIAIVWYLMRDITVVLLVPFLTIFLLIAIYALKNTLTICWLGEIVRENTPIRKAFINGVKLVKKRFVPLYLYYFAIWFFIIFINVLLAALTFAFSLLFTIPISILFISIFNTVTYYHLNPKNYYVGKKIISLKIEQIST